MIERPNLARRSGRSQCGSPNRRLISDTMESHEWMIAKLHRLPKDDNLCKALPFSNAKKIALISLGGHNTCSTVSFTGNHENTYRNACRTLRRFFGQMRPILADSSILLRGEFVRRLNGDRYLRIVQIDCSMFHARRLLERAKQIYPDAVPDIEEALA